MLKMNGIYEKPEHAVVDAFNNIYAHYDRRKVKS